MVWGGFGLTYDKYVCYSFEKQVVEDGGRCGEGDDVQQQHGPNQAWGDKNIGPLGTQEPVRLTQQEYQRADQNLQGKYIRGRYKSGPPNPAGGYEIYMPPHPHFLIGGYVDPSPTTPLQPFTVRGGYEIQSGSPLHLQAQPYSLTVISNCLWNCCKMAVTKKTKQAMLAMAGK